MANRNCFKDFKRMCLEYRQQLATDKAVRAQFERAFKRKTYLRP